MKTRLFLILVSIFLTGSLSLGVILTWWPLGHHVLKAAARELLTPTQSLDQRPNITFILGEDKDEENPYFQHATTYYRQEIRDGLDTVITDLRTLTEVNTYLNNSPTVNGWPWGEIKLVVHSNEWTGLSAPITEGAKRASVEGMREAIKESLFKPLSGKIADSQTQLQLWGCGLGHNTALMQIIGEAFGQATVYSPKYFVQYRKDQWGQMKRYLNRCYYTTYPTGYRPSNTTLVQRFRKKYPNEKVNWNTAIRTDAGEQEHKPYNYDFKIPIVWLVSYENKASRPIVKTQKEKDQWLSQQSELEASFDYYELSKDDFTWTIYPKIHTFEDGITEPSIKAIGLCSILCVLEPIGDPESGTGSAFLPLQPAIEDEAYFGCIK